MPLIDTIIKQTENFLPLALGLANKPKQLKAVIDFQGAASQILSQIEAIKQIANPQERLTATLQIQDAVYAWQRLPQDKAWKSKDNATFKQIEGTLINKLNELRNFSPVITTNGVINTNGINPNLGNTGESNFTLGIENKYLFFGIAGILGYLVLTRK